MAHSLQIDVISDVMCPWCFIGKRRLERAFALMPDIDPDVRWRPFQLDATIPPEGMSRQDYLDRKFGRERAREVYGRIAAAGEAEGIAFAFDRIQVSPNTLNAHRLIRWSAGAGRQDAVVERLFQLYFLEGEDVGRTDVLVQAAEDAGIEGADVRALLETDADKDLVEQEIAVAHQMGVTGVPAFLFGRRYIVMGAQAPELLAQAAVQALQEAEEGPPARDESP